MTALMAQGRQRNLALAAASIAFLCAHMALVSALPRFAPPISYTFLTLAPLFALAACFWQAFSRSVRMRAHWMLVSSGISVWLVADLIESFTQLTSRINPNTATIQDFFYFFYGVPLLLAIALPEEGEATPVFLVLDGVQAAAAGYLSYVVLFGGLPFSGIPQQPMPLEHLPLVYDIQDMVLAVLATARLIVRVGDTEERRFVAVLTSFLWLYAVALGVYNRVAGVENITGVFDVLVDLPFVALGLGVIAIPAPAPRTGRTGARAAMLLLLENGRSILLGLFVVSLSAVVAESHLRVALGFIFGAFVIYGIRSALLQSSIQRTRLALEQARDRLEELALQDGLTGIANRRCFDQRLAAEWNRAQRSGRPLALLLIDVDHFKNLNDSHGHVAGDECLQQLAAALRGTLHRTGDLLARYGGDEFVALLPETNTAGALRVAALMKAALASRKWNCDGSNAAMTISIGCSAWELQPRATAEELLETADRALYHAKETGRNRVEFAEMQTAML